MRSLIIALVCAVLAMMAVVGIKEGRRVSLPAPEASQANPNSEGKIVTISTGEKVDIEAHVPKTGLTVIEFRADFEAACKTIGPQLQAMAKERTDLFLRIIHIDSWSSEVVRQHSVRRLPTLWLYEDGTLTTKDTNEVAARLRQKP